MGIYPIFNPDLAGVVFQLDGKALLRQLHPLDQIARSLGRLPLSSFTDSREVPEDFDGSPDELEELLGPWDEWYAASGGLASAEQLASALRAHPTLAAGLRDSDDICAELDELARCLGAAVQSEVRFRLEIG